MLFPQCSCPRTGEHLGTAITTCPVHGGLTLGVQMICVVPGSAAHGGQPPAALAHAAPPPAAAAPPQPFASPPVCGSPLPSAEGAVHSAMCSPLGFNPCQGLGPSKGHVKEGTLQPIMHCASGVTSCKDNAQQRVCQHASSTTTALTSALAQKLSLPTLLISDTALVFWYTEP